MLTNRSALLLLASDARASSGTAASPSRVRRMRAPSRASSAALTRRAIASATSFSSVPFAPVAPVSCAAVARIDHDRAQAGGHRRQHGAGSGGGRRWSARRRRSGRAEHVDHEARRRRVHRRVRGAEAAEPRAKLDHDRRRALRERARACTQPSEANAGSVASIGVRALEAHDQAARLLRTGCGVGGAMSNTSRAPLPGQLVTDHDARHAKVARDQQPRGLAQLELRLRDERQRARDELDRHIPPPVHAHGRGGKRHQAAGRPTRSTARA